MISWIRDTVQTIGILRWIAGKIIKTNVESLFYWSGTDTWFRIHFEFLARTCRALAIICCSQCHTQLAAAISRASQCVVITGGWATSRLRTNRVLAALAKFSFWIAGAVVIRIRFAFFYCLQGIRIDAR